MTLPQIIRSIQGLMLKQVVYVFMSIFKGLTGMRVKKPKMVSLWNLRSSFIASEDVQIVVILTTMSII
jgi:hypothetical protein